MSSCDPFYDWPIDKVHRLRNECLGKRDGEWFEFEGVTFVMPTALYRANSRLMHNETLAGPSDERGPAQ